MTSCDDMTGFVREVMGLSLLESIEIVPMTARGSDRTFFRVTGVSGGSAILIHYDPVRIENAYYGEIALFLKNEGIPVPRLFGHDVERCLMIMEDLGGEDLWSFRNEPWEKRRILYQKTLAAAVRLHSLGENDFPAHKVRLMAPFGPDLYRWERDYFRDHFVEGVCDVELEPSFRDDLEDELSALAEHLCATAKSLVHRDFQSQNVMIRDGVPFFIDFQGMRFGSPFYDLGSLLCDPYVDFSDNERDELLRFYYSLTKRDVDWPLFQERFWEASAQRLMQALGAYGFLGLKKGLPSFLSHIPSGLAGLDRSVLHTPSLPRLTEVSLLCRKAIEEGGLG